MQSGRCQQSRLQSTTLGRVSVWDTEPEIEKPQRREHERLFTRICHTPSCAAPTSMTTFRRTSVTRTAMATTNDVQGHDLEASEDEPLYEPTVPQVPA